MLWGLRDEPHRIPVTGPGFQEALAAKISEERAASLSRQTSYASSTTTSASDFEAELLEVIQETGAAKRLLAQHQSKELYARAHRINASDNAAIEAQFEKELFYMSYRLDDRLFGWMPQSLYEKHQNSCYAAPISITFMIIVYCVGLASFVLQSQRIIVCEQNLIKIGSPRNYSCKGFAENCNLGGGNFINYKAYVQYRLASYILLLIPFFYIPYMTIVDMTLVARTVWEKINPDIFKKFQNNNVKEFNRNKKEVYKTVHDRDTTFAENKYYTSNTLWESFTTLSPVGHEITLLVLFLVFHVILGGFSIAFDTMMAMTDITQKGSPCYQINDAMSDISDIFTFRLNEAGKYNLSVGSITFILTLYYMYSQLGNTLHKKKRASGIKNKLRNQQAEDLTKLRIDSEERMKHVEALYNEQEQGLNEARGSLEARQKEKK